jgi:hypothetical protein
MKGAANRYRTALGLWAQLVRGRSLASAAVAAASGALVRRAADRLRTVRRWWP